MSNKPVPPDSGQRSCQQAVERALFCTLTGQLRSDMASLAVIRGADSLGQF